jgi:hypothetical protein
VESLEDIKPSVRKFAVKLTAKWPRFSSSLRVKQDGNFEGTLVAPKGSQARVLVCLSSGDSDVWLGLGIPQAFYPVETTSELVRIVELLLADGAVFAITHRESSWTGTTLLGAGLLPKLEPRETCHVYSWSGKNDLVVTRPARAVRGRRAARGAPPNKALDQTALARRRSTP